MSRQWLRTKRRAPMVAIVVVLLTVVTFATVLVSHNKLRTTTHTLTEHDHPSRMAVSNRADRLPQISTTQPTEQSPPDQLRRAKSPDQLRFTSSEAVLSLLHDAVVDYVRNETRALQRDLRAARKAHARRHKIASVRGCFASLIRHSDDGVRKFHRLLVNVRQRMSLMASRYPFVAFMEKSADEVAVARALLSREIDFNDGHEHYGGSVFSFDTEKSRHSLAPFAGDANDAHAARDTAKASDDGDTLERSTVLTSKLLVRAGDDLPVLRSLMKRFVFPRTATHPDPAIRDVGRLRWPNVDSGDISGVQLVSLPEADFGLVPHHIRGGTWPYPQHSYWGVSYRHMCRFFGIRIFFVPPMPSFDYYLRLDTDSFLLGTPVSLASARDGGASSTSEPEEVDYFEVMQETGSRYAFSMFHPQTIPQFKVDLYDTYDAFLSSENQDKYAVDAVVERHLGRVGRSTTSPLYKPLSELPFPRGDVVHFWDNFEIVDLSIFREQRLSESQEAYAREQRAAHVALRSERTESMRAVNGAPLQLSQWFPADERIGVFPESWRSDDFDALLPGHLTNAQVRDRILRSGVVAERILSSPGAWFGTGAPRLTPELVAAALAEALDEHIVVQARASFRRQVDKQVRHHNERRRRILSWFQLVETRGGFYYHRWGDAEIRTLTVALFLHPTEILYCDSLPYQHYFNYHCPNTVPTAASACEREAQNAYGDGIKQRGTARMQPAELSTYNAAFERLRAQTPGGWRSV